MQEEFERKESVSIQTETLTSVNEETKQTLDSLPRIEEIRKSEQEIKVKTEIEGTTQVKSETQAKDRVFTRKADEKRVYLKKRVKILTAVYTTVVVLMLAFVISNIATLAKLNKDISSNTNTIKNKGDLIEQVIDEVEPGLVGENPIEIKLNTPRDYSEDKKELTWLDKVTIIFKNIFG